MSPLLLLAAMPAMIAGPLAADVVSVYDGDSFTARVYSWPGTIHEADIRLRGIDAPEIRGSKCAREKELAAAARDRLRDLLSHGEVTLRNVAPDKYGGRFDADVFVDDRPIGLALVIEGLARPYSGGTRMGWCE